MVDASTVVSDGGVTVQRRGRDVLHYQAGDRYIDFTLEFGYTGASVYTKDIRTWQPNGEPFTAEEREIVERHMRDVLRLHGYAEADFGLP